MPISSTYEFNIPVPTVQTEETSNAAPKQTGLSAPKPNRAQTSSSSADTTDISSQINLRDINSIETTIHNVFQNYPNDKSFLGSLAKEIDVLIDERGRDGLNNIEKLITTLIKTTTHPELKYALLGRIAHKTQNLPNDQFPLAFALSTASSVPLWLEGILPPELNDNKWPVEARMKDLKMTAGKKPNGSWFMSAGLEAASFIGPAGANILRSLPFMGHIFSKAGGMTGWLGIQASVGTNSANVGNIFQKFFSGIDHRIAGSATAGITGGTALATHGIKQIKPSAETVANGEFSTAELLGAQSLADFAQSIAQRNGLWSRALDGGGVIALTGAGATIGSLIPVVGTGIGALAGLGLGALNLWMDSEQKGRFANFEEVKKELGYLKASYINRTSEDLREFITSSRPSFSEAKENSSEIAPSQRVLPAIPNNEDNSSSSAKPKINMQNFTG